MKETIVVTGGTGFIGKHLCQILQDQGFEVMILGRKPKHTARVKVYEWNYHSGYIESGILSRAHYIIHLAGAGIGNHRWTSSRRKEILDSRVKASELLYKTWAENKGPLKAFISASATGIYGSNPNDPPAIETDPPAKDFLGGVCNTWESASNLFSEAGIRVVILRTGIVLGKNGGVLRRITFPAKLGLCFVLGNGKQWMPWIHITDICWAYIYAVQNQAMNGAYNIVSPQHITNQTLMKALSKQFHKSFILIHIPGIILQLTFGKMAKILLEGRRIDGTKLLQTGYEFKFSQLEDALNDLYSG